MIQHPTYRPSAADRDKRRVALTSLFAAVLLTGTKLGVGLWTNSLGILAEAAHSALDLGATVVTLWAVGRSGQPADSRHTYGHGKFENLSALIQTGLLIVTCVWIVHEATRRLAPGAAPEVDANFWAFAVVTLSIFVDVGRSRALTRAARRYHSQALEADALHFSTDIWSSSVVLLGLIAMRVGELTGARWLHHADAVAALGVAAIVVIVALRLGRRAVDALLDAVPDDLRDRVYAVCDAVPGVLAVRRVRVRQSGPERFADVTVAVGRETGLEAAHEIANRAEEALREVLPDADVVVHVEPIAAAGEDLLTTVRVMAARRGLGAHAIRIHDHHGRRELALHLEVGAELRLAEAHDQVDAFERDVHEALPEIDRITTHIEPVGPESATRRAEPTGTARLRAATEDALVELGLVSPIHDIRVQWVGSELAASLTIGLDAGAAITAAHDATERLEKALRARLPELGRVTIHVEPRE